MSKYPHLHIDMMTNADLSNGDRIQWIKKNRWIGYPRAHEILGKMEDLLNHPKQARMPSMLLVGSSNNGKTSIIRQFTQRHPVLENPGYDHIIAPVLYIEAPPAPKESAFYMEILSTLYEDVPSGSDEIKRARVVQVLKEIKLKVLIIDELHNLLAGASTKQQQFLNMIKYLSNKLNISIVGCGTGDLIRAISVDTQIQNRFPPEIIPQWRMGKEFRQLAVSFESVLPLREPSGLHEKMMSSKLLAMSEGTIGELSMLLNNASIYAINKGIEKITVDVLNKCGYVSPSDRANINVRI